MLLFLKSVTTAKIPKGRAVIFLFSSLNFCSIQVYSSVRVKNCWSASCSPGHSWHLQCFGACQRTMQRMNTRALDVISLLPREVSTLYSGRGLKKKMKDSHFHAHRNFLARVPFQCLG